MKFSGFSALPLVWIFLAMRIEAFVVAGERELF
jgi:hypothetical protein